MLFYHKYNLQPSILISLNVIVIAPEEIIVFLKLNIFVVHMKTLLSLPKYVKI